MSKTFETTVEIKGAIGSSFTSAFRNASTGLVDLRGEARAVQQELDRLGRDFRQGKIHQSQYTEETQKLRQELNSVEKEMQDVANAQKRLAAETAIAQKRMDDFKSGLMGGVGNAFNNVKATASIVAVGAAAATTALAFNSLNTASDFEAQMSKVSAKTQATKAEMDALRESALKLGASTSLSASETAVAMDDLAAGGMNANQIIAAMPGIISGAEASGEDLSLVSNTVSTALSIWSMKAEEAAKVSDVLAMSANMSSASVEDMSYAFKYAGKPAADLGLSLEEVSAAVAIMTNSGLDGSNAGTALRASLLSLNAPTTKQQKLMNQLGFSIENSSGEAKSLSEMVGDLSVATKGMTDQQKVATMETLVGTEAVSGFLALVSAGPEQIDKMTTSLENSAGASEKAASIMMDNYAGAKEQMLGAFDSAKIAFATPILPVLQDTFDGIATIMENNMPAIENAGKAVAEVLEDITAPFATTEPIKPVITPNMDPTDAQNAIKQYYKDLEKYEMFSGMDMSDKVEYMLDTTVDQFEEWLDGEGGESVERIFGELANLAASAWTKSFTTAIKGSASQLLEGNVGGAVAMGIAANAMTGGLLLTGGLSAGKWAVGKGKDIYDNKKSQKASADDSTPTVIESGQKEKSKTKSNKTKASTTVVKNGGVAKESAKSTPAATRTARNAASKSGGLGKALTKFGKIGGKAFLPLSLLASAADIATSKNKSKAIGSAAGGTGGGIAGAAAGAALGSVIPIVGTVAGGIIGGIAGGLGGDWLGGKIGGLFGGGEKASAAPVPTSNSAVANTTTAPDFTALNSEVAKATQSASLLTQYLGQASGMIYGSFYPLQESANMTTQSMSLLTMYAGQASGMVYGSFYPLQEQTNLVTQNMGLLASYTSQATGWLSTLQGIQPAGQRVINALNNLEQRINNIELPGTSNRRLNYE